VKVVLGKDLLAANENKAAKNRELFDQAGILVVNLISSPGSGKTTLLEKTARFLGGDLKMGAIVGDLYTDRDARRLSEAGMVTVQINTEGVCHLDAKMVARALQEMPMVSLDLLFIENVGNLVCPAAFDLGEHVKVAVLSVAEGTDKPAKYPGIFRESGAVVINKSDLLPYTDFNVKNCLDDLRGIKENMAIFITSAKTGEGIDQWCKWLRESKGNMI